MTGTAPSANKMLLQEYEPIISKVCFLITILFTNQRISEEEIVSPCSYSFVREKDFSSGILSLVPTK